MWIGRLELQLEQVGARTVITRRRHQGPLLVQRAFYEEDGGSQVYLIHPPGGVVGGDQLWLGAELGPAARALLTTPAATKIYRSRSETAELTQRCQLGDGAILELFPQETILYDGARAKSSTQVSLGLGAQFFGWEVLCLGRDVHGFAEGHFAQRWRIERQGRLLWSERTVLEGGSAVLQAPWGLAGRPVLGTLVCTGAEQVSLEALRLAIGAPVSASGDTSEAIPEVSFPAPNADWQSVTRLGEVLVCRYLGYSAEAAKRSFSAVWTLLRPAVSGRKAVPPRVWAT
jgi:urease accessory protein